MPEENKNPAPEEIWATYCGDINAANVAKLVNGLTTVGVSGTKRIHILFQSWGGFVGDGVFLYNALKKFSIEVVLYNAGQVASAAAIAFLGAHARKTTANAVFMIHKATNSPNGAGVDKLKVVADNLAIDDGRIEDTELRRYRSTNVMRSGLTRKFHRLLESTVGIVNTRNVGRHQPWSFSWLL
jgi:ATP-dependent protease ClpP protease subunit